MYRNSPRVVLHCLIFQGGYLTEIDGFYMSEPVYFISNRGMPVTIHYPKDDEINDAQKSYITQYYNMFEDSFVFQKILPTLLMAIKNIST